MAKSSRRSTRKHGGKRNTRRNALTRKNRGVFGYVASPVTTLAKGATNVVNKTAGIGANIVFGTAGNLVSTGRKAVHKLGYGASNILETGTGAMNNAIGRLLGSKSRKNSRKAGRKNRKNLAGGKRSRKVSRKVGRKASRKVSRKVSRKASRKGRKASRKH
jgi:hypothetical protein